jgi:hypothetical protein
LSSEWVASAHSAREAMGRSSLESVLEIDSQHPQRRLRTIFSLKIRVEHFKLALACWHADGCDAAKLMELEH